MKNFLIFSLILFVTNLASAVNIDDDLKTWVLREGRASGNYISGKSLNGCRAIISAPPEHVTRISGSSATIVWNGVKGKYHYDNNITLNARSNLLVYFNGHRVTSSGDGVWYFDQSPVYFKRYNLPITASLPNPLIVVTPSKIRHLSVIVGGLTATCLEMDGSQYWMGPIGGSVGIGFLPLIENKEILEGPDLDTWDVNTTSRQWFEMGRLSYTKE